MTLRFGRLDDVTRPAFERLLEQVWDQNWDRELARALVDWRYYDKAPDGDTLLAFDDDRCVALLDSFVRPYLLDGREILVRETCDWFCMPKYRPLGVGIRLMRQMMTFPEPLLSIGGSEATLAILPRLGWKALPNVQKLFLPVKARSLAGSLLRRGWPTHEALAKVIPAFIPLRPPRRVPTPPDGIARVGVWQPGAPISLPHPDRQGLIELLTQVDRDWLAKMPDKLARPLGLMFFLDEEPVGFSPSQLEPAASGFDGCIVHLQVAHEAQPLVDWVVSETARHLAMHDVGIVRCCAASPAKVAALQRAGFILWKPLLTYWWHKEGGPTPASIDAGYLRADDAIPFPALRGRRLGARNGSLSNSAA